MRGFATIPAALVLVCASGPVSRADAVEKSPPAKAAPAKASAAKAPAKAAPALTAESFTRVFTRLGLEHEVSRDDEGGFVIYYKKNGYNVGLYPYKDSKGLVDSYQFQAGFETKKDGLEKSVAEWNDGKRFARAVVRDDGDPEIRYDVLVVRCGFETQLEEEIDLFQLLLEEFGAHLPSE